jgi:hypothetical protein
MAKENHLRYLNLEDFDFSISHRGLERFGIKIEEGEKLDKEQRYLIKKLGLFAIDFRFNSEKWTRFLSNHFAGHFKALFYNPYNQGYFTEWEADRLKDKTIYTSSRISIPVKIIGRDVNTLLLPRGYKISKISKISC